jgi:hypothetical protein
MKAISKRLGRLEDRFGLGPETEYDRQVRERVETFLRRVAERRARGGLPPLEADDRQREDLTGLTIAEIIRRGRFGPRASGGNDRA